MILLPDFSKVIFNAVIPGTSDSGTKINTAYIEFVNGDAIEPPEVNPASIADYFVQLGSTPDRDYLRVPILSHVVGKTDTGAAKLEMTVAADGETGVHGKSFSAAVGSRIYGFTLAASQGNDRGDILVVNHYYPPAEQIAKTESGSMILSVTIT
jgi:hypothetical protein